ncbi:sulfoacetaldehyde acetyltransferase [Microbacterium faecale]|uniref:Sulfoacetaldehyde acetyltransferase n=1 Tax=Microbacterium faecale TaxID=1804630 RepID=A0A916Y537_9MICO|nr:sulfoacetaldehyde acetyltransferase [Microbacterium faecale]
MSTVFGINGSAIVDPLDLFTAAGIDFIQVRNEQNAGGMADGYTQASGKITVCIGQNGPGITNLVSGVAMAYANHTPMIVVTPSVTTMQSGSHIVQEVDQMALLSGVTVFQHKVARADRIPWAMRAAFRSALIKRGPAQVDIPRDLFYDELDWDEQAPASYRHSGLTQPAQSDIDAAVELLATARRPLIVCGLGVAQTEAFPQVGQLADLVDAGVTTIYNHNDAFDNSHPRYVGPLGYSGSKFAMEHSSHADVVLALGTRLNPTGTSPQYDVDFWPADARLILNDADPLNIGANHPIDVGLVGDCALTVDALVSALESRGIAPDRETATVSAIAEGKNAWWRTLSDEASGPASVLSPKAALLRLAELTPNNAIVTADAGNATSFVTTYFEFTRGRSLMMPGTFGSMGGAFANAIGAKVAAPERPVIAISGDGAWGTGLQEVLTAVAEDAPVISVVLNNGSLAAERANQLGFLGGRFYACDLDNPDFAAIAELMGATGITVRTLEELEIAYTNALASSKPVVLDVHVDVEVLAPPRRKDALQSRERLHPRYARDAKAQSETSYE